MCSLVYIEYKYGSDNDDFSELKRYIESEEYKEKIKDCLPPEDNFGVKSNFVPRDGIKVSSLTGGMNIIEYNTNETDSEKNRRHFISNLISLSNADLLSNYITIKYDYHSYIFDVIGIQLDYMHELEYRGLKYD
jgi:hypothetical protein